MSGLSLKDQSQSLKISEQLLKSIAIAKRLIAKLDRAKILEMEFISIQARGGLISRGLIIRRFFKFTGRWVHNCVAPNEN